MYISYNKIAHVCDYLQINTVHLEDRQIVFPPGLSNIK
jgi:hypothetical protein